MTSFNTVNLTCPCCENAFKGERLASTNTFGGQTTDFHQVAVGFEPLFFMIATCPACGFTASTSKWPASADLNPEIRARIRAEITPLIGDGSPSADLSYRFLAQIGQWEGLEPQAIADRYLRGAWCAASRGRREDEIACRRLAIEQLELALNDPAIEHRLRQTFTYLVGEVYRRIGEREQAAEWFNRAIAQALPDDDPFVVKAATQQRDDPKEFFRDFPG